MPVLRNASTPPLRPSQGRARSEAAFEMRTSVYSGTCTTWDTAAKRFTSGAPSRSTPGATSARRASSHRPAPESRASSSSTAERSASGGSSSPICSTSTSPPAAKPETSCTFSSVAPAGAPAVSAVAALMTVPAFLTCTLPCCPLPRPKTSASARTAAGSSPSTRTTSPSGNPGTRPGTKRRTTEVGTVHLRCPPLVI